MIFLYRQFYWMFILMHFLLISILCSTLRKTKTIINGNNIWEGREYIHKNSREHYFIYTIFFIEMSMYTKTFFLIYADSDHIFLPTVTFIVICLFLSVYIPAVALSLLLSPALIDIVSLPGWTFLHVSSPHYAGRIPSIFVPFHPSPSVLPLVLISLFPSPLLKSPMFPVLFNSLSWSMNELGRRARSELPRIQEC